MADWNLAFDYAACFILLLIMVWYFNEKRIPLKSHKTFLWLLVTDFAATALEITATHIARSMDTFRYSVFWFTLNLQGLLINLVPVVFAYYILQLGHVNIQGKRGLKFFFGLSVMLHIVAMAINLFTGWAFDFTDNRYTVRAGSTLPYVIDFIMLVIVVATMIRCSRSFTEIRSVSLLFNLVCGIAACVLQLAAYIPTLNFVLASLCLTLYYYLQNSSAVTDQVTKQFNRKFMGEYVQSYFAEGKSFGLIALAMDDFKFINKTYGVDNGDNLLQQVGNFLDSIKANKTVFRFGSDQFCLILNKNLDSIEQVAETIHERFKHPWYSETQIGIMMSASICCMECPRDAAFYGDLIEVLDYSMSVAKKTSKGKITKTADMNLEMIQRDKAVEKAVKQAMDKDELMVYYQPIYSVSKGVYNSAEALVRLHDDNLGWISPEVFIPIAEKNGLIIEMGEMILEKVCRFIHDFNLSETTVEYIEVNISPAQLVQLNFAERVKAIMEKYDVSPEQINIEITETATISAAETVNENIDKLVQYGISFSLDDYGSGYANIEYINRMPFKIIKLDKYIIWDAFKNNKAGITLKYTIGMLNELDLYIVAEGVETEEMRDHLVDVGCHYMQGWYYSKAVSDVEFVRLICSN